MANVLSDTELAAICADADDVWAQGNLVLYNLCAQHPRHLAVPDVVAKLWLIGRAYTAAIERHPPSQTGPKTPLEQFYAEVATAVIASSLDAQLGSLSPTGPKRPLDLAPALLTHLTLVNTIKHLAGNQQRSFASKYLHFHLPAWFFIMDTVAGRGLRRILGRLTHARTLMGSGDAEYSAFVSGAWTLRERIADESGKLLTPRQLDRLLLKRGA